MPEGDLTDEELVVRFKESGRLDCLEELFSRYMGKVRAMIYPMVLNNTDTDDLAQEVFLRAARSLGGFRGRARFSTWLYRIAMNTTHTFLKQQGRKRVHETSVETDNPGPRTQRPDVTTEARELDAHIQEALGGLARPLRAAITLTVLEGMDVSEAARVEQCTRATMYWRVHEARKQLRGLLEPYLKS